jgi:hypothetical protein
MVHVKQCKIFVHGHSYKLMAFKIGDCQLVFLLFMKLAQVWAPEDLHHFYFYYKNGLIEMSLNLIDGAMGGMSPQKKTRVIFPNKKIVFISSIQTKKFLPRPPRL